MYEIFLLAARSEDGYELQLQVSEMAGDVTSDLESFSCTLTSSPQVNHLAPLLLSLELLPLLEQTAGVCGDSRLVFVSSRAHARASWDSTNLNAELSYSPFTFYARSKLYNVE